MICEPDSVFTVSGFFYPPKNSFLYREICCFYSFLSKTQSHDFSPSLRQNGRNFYKKYLQIYKLFSQKSFLNFPCFSKTFLFLTFFSRKKPFFIGQFCQFLTTFFVYIYNGTAFPLSIYPNKAEKQKNYLKTRVFVL